MIWVTKILRHKNQDQTSYSIQELIIATNLSRDIQSDFTVTRQILVRFSTESKTRKGFFLFKCIQTLFKFNGPAVQSAEYICPICDLGQGQFKST